MQAFRDHTQNQMSSDTPLDGCGNGAVHYTFDFAQDLLLPFYVCQPGKLFFQSPFKVSLFGIACETLKRAKLFCHPRGFVWEHCQVSEVAIMCYIIVGLLL